MKETVVDMDVIKAAACVIAATFTVPFIIIKEVPISQTTQPLTPINKKNIKDNP